MHLQIAKKKKEKRYIFRFPIDLFASLISAVIKPYIHLNNHHWNIVSQALQSTDPHVTACTLTDFVAFLIKENDPHQLMDVL